MPSLAYTTTLHTIRHWLYRHYRAVILIGWILLLLSTYTLLTQTDLDTQIIALGVLTVLTTNWWGPLVYIATYIVRPLVLLPVSIFSVTSGVVFGVWPGLLVTYVGIIISGSVAYALGRWLGRSLQFTSMVPKGPNLIKRRPFEVVLSLHLTMLPYDLVNYSLGMARIPFPPFLFGILLGMIPGTISLTLLGASVNIETLLNDGLSTNTFDLRYFGLSLVIFLLSLAGSYLYRRYYRPYGNSIHKQ